MLMYALQAFKVRCNILVWYPFEKFFNHALNVFNLRNFSLTMTHYQSKHVIYKIVYIKLRKYIEILRILLFILK